jgi:hypothetical protein
MEIRMAEETPTKRNAFDTPVSPAELNRMTELDNAYMELGARLLDLENDKVKILVSARRIEEEKQRLFEKILMDRGIAPSTPVEIDRETGALSVIRRPGQEP